MRLLAVVAHGASDLQHDGAVALALPDGPSLRSRELALLGSRRFGDEFAAVAADASASSTVLLAFAGAGAAGSAS